MSTYDDAILILPQGAGYKAGEIYSLKPTDGTADATVTRATECDEIDSTGESVEVAANVPRYDFRGDYVELEDNSYYDFDGGGTITIPTVSSLDFNHAFTLISCGTKTTTLSSEFLLGKYKSSGNQRSYSLEIDENNKLVLWATGNGLTLWEWSSTSSVSLGSEHTYSAVYNGVDVKMYLDGVLIASSLTLGVFTSTIYVGTADFQAGNRGDSGGGYLTGNTKNIKAFNLALSAPEILDIHNGLPIPDKYKGATNVNFYNSDAGTFVSGTYSWAAYGSNTIANVGNALEITYISSASGAYNYFKESGDLEKNLVVGEKYRVTFDAKYTGGAGGVTIGIPNVGVYTDSLTTSLINYTLEFTATSIDGDYLRLNLLSASNVVTIDNIEITKLGNTLNLSKGKTDSIWYDLEHDIQGTVTGATLTDGTDFGDNHYPTNTCPVLLSEDSFTNHFLNSRTPITQTVTGLTVGTTYTINCKGGGVVAIGEVSGSELGGTATEVYSFTYEATSTSVVITLSAGNSFDWVQLSDTDEPKNHVETLGSTVTKAADVTEITTPAGVVEIIETINGVEQAPITTIPVTYQAPYDRLNSTIMN
ncbi:MAG: LamG domain-containing protein [Proteobacteria bacterium]|nr:LamG domain-containing protein [Pseudomonadota bacterium]